MTTSDDDKGNEVGYGKPPKEHQFKKGQSGNPKGRPKGAKNAATLLNEQLYGKVTITEKGRRKQVAVVDVMFRRIIKAALEGDARAQDRLIKLLPLADSAASDAEQGAQVVRPDKTDEAILRHFLESRGAGFFDADEDEGEGQ